VQRLPTPLRKRVMNGIVSYVEWKEARERRKRERDPPAPTGAPLVA